MKVIHFNLEYLSGIRGGDRCTFETVRYFSAQGVRNILFTTDSAKETYTQHGLVENEYLRYFTIPSYFGNNGSLDILQAYLRRTIAAFKALKHLDVCKDDVLFCHNDFFPNSLPVHRVARKHPGVQLLYWFHMLAPDLFKGYRGQFTGKNTWPSPLLIRYRLDQWLYGKLIQPHGIIVTNNPWYRTELQHRFPDHRIHIVERFGGDAVPRLSVKKEYDLVWCGRFHAQKGIDELIDIVDRVRNMKPDVSLLLIGFGAAGDERRLKRLIRQRGMESHITLAGHLDGEDKFHGYQSARIFVMPSYFESFGLVNIEAMKCGLPVVAYDLPVYGVFREGMVKVPILDNDRMAQEIVRLLRDQQAYGELSEQALHFSNEFLWERTGEELLNLVYSLVPAGG